MPTLHLMVGLPCSGKSTYAKELEKKHRALLLSTDAWHLKLFGEDTTDPAHDARHSQVEKIIWEVAERALTLDVDVILDFGCWARVERDEFRTRARAAGAKFKIHYMEVPIAELFRRLKIRNQECNGNAFIIPESYMETYLNIFQPPTPEELADEA